MHFFGEKFVEKDLIICKIWQIKEVGNDRDVDTSPRNLLAPMKLKILVTISPYDN